MRGLLLSEEVGAYLLRHHSRDMHALFGLLERLDQASMAAQRRLTIPFIRELMRTNPSGQMLAQPGAHCDLLARALCIEQPERPIQFGRWVDFVFKFRHNVSGNGLLQVWMDGQQIVNHAGNLGFNTPKNPNYQLDNLVEVTEESSPLAARVTSWRTVASNATMCPLSTTYSPSMSLARMPPGPAR